MIKIFLEVRDAKRVRQGLQDLMAEIPKVGRSVLYNSLVEARKILSQEPPGFPEDRSYPWVSTKQRMAVMAMIKKEEIEVPYRRTHQYSKSYQIRRAENGWVLFNDVPWAHWVAGTGEGQGGYQASVHAGRWAALDPTLREVLSKVDIRILNRLAVIIEDRTAE